MKDWNCANKFLNRKISFLSLSGNFFVRTTVMHAEVLQLPQPGNQLELPLLIEFKRPPSTGRIELVM